MCGSPGAPKFHYPLCPECRKHVILSQKHIRCRCCRARRNGRKGLKARRERQAVSGGQSQR